MLKTSNQTDQIIIKLSRSKIILITLGAVGFVALGFWMLTIADTQSRYGPIYMKILAVASISFFGLCGLYGLLKLFDNKPGLILNQEGLLDNSSAVGGHLIKWDDITGLEVEQVKSTKFLLIYVKNPKDYYTGASRFKKFWMIMNERIYGTPLSLSSASLQCDFDELITAIENNINKRITQQEH